MHPWHTRWQSQAHRTALKAVPQWFTGNALRFRRSEKRQNLSASADLFQCRYTRVEASRHSAKALLSSLPLLPARDRDASGRHRNILKNKNPFANAQKKTPGKIPRAFAMLGRSAWPISVKSGLVYEFFFAWEHAAWLPAAFKCGPAQPRA
jgi:hypothetical protein